jgi:hypothetical protein
MEVQKQLHEQLEVKPMILHKTIARRHSEKWMILEGNQN